MSKEKIAERKRKGRNVENCEPIVVTPSHKILLSSSAIAMSPKDKEAVVAATTTSRYFSSPERETIATPTSAPHPPPPSAVKRKRSSPTKKRLSTFSSKYFCDEKCSYSIRGGVMELGPLVYTWYDDDNNHNNFSHHVGCERLQNSINNGIFPCNACNNFIISDICCQFIHCPTFQRLLENQKHSTVFENLKLCLEKQQNYSCIELVGILMESTELLRHLCEHGCYLRAFAPRREWCSLRAEIYHTKPTGVGTKINESIETQLKSWTCKLKLPDSITESKYFRDMEGADSAGRCCIDERDPNTVATSSPVSRTKKIVGNRDALPRIQFVNKENGNKYSTQKQVLRALELVAGANRERLMPHCITSSPTKTSSTKLSSSMRGSTINETSQELTHGNMLKLLYCQPTTTADTPTMNSPLGLLEELFSDDPWRLLLSTILLNRTRRIQVDRVMFRFLQLWPTVEDVLTADVREIGEVISPLGIHKRRAEGIHRVSTEFVSLVNKKTKETEEKENPGQEERLSCNSLAAATKIDRPSRRRRRRRRRSDTAFRLTRSEITNFYNCGDYAADAYQIFILQDWKNLRPKDHALNAYVEWKRSIS